MSDEKTLAQIRSNRNQVTGILLSDVEARETLEEGTLSRLMHATEKINSYNQNVLEYLKNLSFECGWGLSTGYSIDSLRNEAEQDLVDRDFVKLFADASANAVAISGNDRPNTTITKLKQQQQLVNSSSAGSSSSNMKIVVPDLSPYGDLLSTLMKERVPDDVQPRVRKTVDTQFLKPFFPEEFSSEPSLQNLSKLLMNVSNIIIVASKEEAEAEAAKTGNPNRRSSSITGNTSGIFSQSSGTAASGGFRKRRSGVSGSGVGGKLHLQGWKQRKYEIEKKIRILQEGGTLEEEEGTQSAGAAITTALLRRGDDNNTSGSAHPGLSRSLNPDASGNNSPASLISSPLGGGGGGGGALDPQTIFKIEQLLESELDICEGWFDASAKTASDFVVDTKQQEANDALGSAARPASSMVGGGMTLSSAQLIRTKDEIAEATQTLFRLREDRSGGLQDLKYDREKLEEMMEEKNEEDLKARVEYKKFCEENQRKLEKNAQAQHEGWQRILKEMEGIAQLSTEAGDLVKSQVSAAEAELERIQRFDEVRYAKDAQVNYIEKLRANFKSALRLIDTTCEFLGTGQSKITTAKVGADLSSGLRAAAATLHESYFEYASRLCRRVHNCEKRMAASALVQRNVDDTLVDLKSAKVIADDAATLIRSLATTRDTFLERLDLATDKLERHLSLHKSIRDAESTNHSSERPVQQRIKDLEVMLREDVIRTLAGHVSQESIFLDVARSRLEVAAKMTGADDDDDDNSDEDDVSENDDDEDEL